MEEVKRRVEEWIGRGDKRSGGDDKIDQWIACGCMKFYYSLLSPVPLPPSPDSMAPSRAVRMKRNTSSDVNFILGWPVT